MQQTLKIGQLSKATGCQVETIRFYQRKGLLLEPDKPYGSIRRYGEADVTRVRFVKSAQRLGFSLDEIAELLRLENLEFLLSYSAVGAVFAGLIFVTSAISIPMILDRQVDAISAGLTSMRACAQNPGVMLLWGALIALLVLLAMLPWFLGLLVIGPVLGHATWHAYRHLVPPQEAG